MSAGIASTPDDLYEVLQVSPTADSATIKAAYRRLALEYHPDRNPHTDTTAQMQRINAAYETLRSPLRRADYDRDRALRRAQPVPPSQPEPTASTPPKRPAPAGSGTHHRPRAHRGNAHRPSSTRLVWARVRRVPTGWLRGVSVSRALILLLVLGSVGLALAATPLTRFAFSSPASARPSFVPSSGPSSRPSSGQSAQVLVTLDFSDVAIHAADKTLQDTRTVIERRLRGSNISGFHVRDDDSTPFTFAIDVDDPSQAAAAAAVVGRRGFVDFREEKPANGTFQWVPVQADGLGAKPTPLTGEYFQTVHLDTDADGGWTLYLTFDPEGTQLLAAITRRLIGHHLGLFVDGTLVATPFIDRPVTDGRLKLSSSAPLTMPDPRPLMTELKYGPLPVPIARCQVVGGPSASQRC